MGDPNPETTAVSRSLELPVEVCPVCSSRLESRHCKFVCPRCGYFMSCSEFE
jgi:predicted RNA-binding Zn-ribbon protein involved in translation (DUF1610 family)